MLQGSWRFSRRALAVALIFVAGFAAHPLLRAECVCDPKETRQEADNRAASCELLKQGQYAALDTKLTHLQQDFEAGRITDISLMHMFRAFCGTSAAVEPRYVAWIAASPRSYTARLAHGIYLRNLAYEARGDRFISQTSSKQIENMEAYARLAMVDLRSSLPLTAKPLLSYHAMMGLTMIMGDDAASKAVVDAANRIDPKNFVVRMKYLLTLTPRWGGSVEQMVDFRKTAQRAGLPPDQLVYFDEMIASERK
jgi:hypothetical protein